MRFRSLLIAYGSCLGLLNAQCATSSEPQRARMPARSHAEPAKIIGYIPVWRSEEGFDYAADELYQSISHGIVAFLMFDQVELGAFEASSVAQVHAVLPSAVTSAHRNGTKVLIALGGATDCGFLRLMTAIGADATHPLLERTVERVVELVHAHALDGVDLDLECWWGQPGDKDQGGRSAAEGPHPAGRALALFAETLRHALPDKLVSATLFGTAWYGNNYDPSIADHTDWLGIMSYDLTGSWNGSPVGPHSALRKLRSAELPGYLAEQQGDWPGGGPDNNPILTVEDTLRYWTNRTSVDAQAVPRNKIAAGVPLYGYDFAYAQEPDGSSGYKTLRYRDIVAEFPGAENAPGGHILQPGSAPRPSFVSASGNYPFAHNIYFETPATAVAKLRFVREQGSQGVIIWELSNDVWENGKSITQALYQASGWPPKPRR